jgi:hypothetical protein
MRNSEMNSAEVGRRGEEIYQQSIRPLVETEDNIGKMVIIDVETGDYEVGDEKGIEASRRLHARREGSAFYGKRIGYNAVAALGGVMERASS